MPESLVYVVAGFLGVVGTSIAIFLIKRANQPVPAAGTTASTDQEPSTDRLASAYADGRGWYHELQSYYAEQLNRERNAQTMAAAGLRLQDALVRYRADLDYLSICATGDLVDVVLALLDHVDQVPDAQGNAASPGHTGRIQKYFAETDGLLLAYRSAARAETGLSAV